MLKIFKYMKEFWFSIILVFGLLVIQAFCDLSLPTYTSRIVDTGIQQNGIAYAVPEVIRESEYHYIKMFMTEDEAARLDESYRLLSEDQAGQKDYKEYLNKYPLLSKEPLYLCTVSKDDALEELSALMSLPISTLSSVKKMGGDEFLREMDQNPQPGAIHQMREQVAEQMGLMSESLVAQQAISYIGDEYEAIGVDIGSMRNGYIINTGLKMLGVTLLMVAASILVGLISSKVAAGVGMRLRNQVFHKVVSFSNAEMDHFSTASLITRSTNDIQQVQMVAVMLLRMVFYAPILGVGGVLKVAGTKTGMGWIIGVAVGAILALVMVLFFIAMPKFKKMQSLVDRLNLVSREILTGLPVIRAFSREKYEEKRFEAGNRNLMKTQLFTSRVMTFMMPAMMLIMNGITLLIVWNGGIGIDAGNLQVGDMMAFITYTMQIVMSFLMITMISIMLPRAGVSANRINEILVMEPTIFDKPEASKSKPVSSKEVTVSFENVSFSYPGAEEPVLEEIDFRAEPGKTTAIIGSTGSGKSTLVHLLPRFYDVTKGRITLNGTDIRDITQHDLRECIGFVPQKGVLFSGTIASNLRFGKEELSEESMKEAASIAQASDFIEEKEDGYDSAIAQDGTNVSGGQKQRLSIARAIAKNPPIYIFDDSFSALDYKTDTALRRALKDKMADSTVILVAQRISTVLHAEQILVLDEGRIVGKGTHEELLESCTTYQEIARSQLSESELKGKGGENA